MRLHPRTHRNSPAGIISRRVLLFRGERIAANRVGSGPLRSKPARSMFGHAGTHPALQSAPAQSSDGVPYFGNPFWSTSQAVQIPPGHEMFWTSGTIPPVADITAASEAPARYMNLAPTSDPTSFQNPSGLNRPAKSELLNGTRSMTARALRQH